MNRTLSMFIETLPLPGIFSFHTKDNKGIKIRR